MKGIPFNLDDMMISPVDVLKSGSWKKKSLIELCLDKVIDFLFFKVPYWNGYWNTWNG